MPLHEIEDSLEFASAYRVLISLCGVCVDGGGFHRSILAGNEPCFPIQS